MKNHIIKLLDPTNRSDYIRLSILGGVNALLCIIGYWIALAVLAILCSVVAPWASYYDWDFEFSIVLKLSVIIVAIADTILAGMMIRKLRVWVLSLPLQYILCFISSCIEQLSGDGIDLEFSAIFALTIILVQLPGVVIGLFIRYLIRKRRARKQPTPA